MGRESVQAILAKESVYNMRSKSMIQVLVGHRGAGKSAFLKFLQKTHHHFKGFDLDHEIEKEISIKEFFSRFSEADFRKKEKDVFQKLVQQNPQCVAVGAGFDLEFLKGGLFQIVWIRRVTDCYGRIFFNRPRLLPELSVLEESLTLFKKRQTSYEKLCHRVITLPEGWDGESLDVDLSGMSFTCKGDFQHLLSERVSFFEFRDDLLESVSDTELEAMIDSVPLEKRLFSFRSKKRRRTLWTTKGGVKDWDISLGKAPFSVDILSCHEAKSVEEMEMQFEAEPQSSLLHLKLAIPIKNFQELQKAHGWWLKSPKNRSFLPCSPHGRWKWYRHIMRGRMKLNFFTEGVSVVPDQPLRLELSPKDSSHYFAAVLGDPIDHSFTPFEQKKFFQKFHMKVVAVPLSEQEVTFENFEFLKELGLKACAVTAPLKKKVCEFFSLKMLSCNTLYFDGSFVYGTNTDVEGFKALLENIKDSKTKPAVLWGGGGVIPTMKSLWPELSSYSARKAEPRAKEKKIKDPYTVVWALPAHRKLKPPSHWRPRYVLDLNYTENSYARSYALHKEACYISGKSFFKAQALKQRAFWQKHLQS